MGNTFCRSQEQANTIQWFNTTPDQEQSKEEVYEEESKSELYRIECIEPQINLRIRS